MLEVLFCSSLVEKITLVLRREIPIDPDTDKKIRQVILSDVSDLAEDRNGIKNADVAFCCIGTTLNKVDKARIKIIIVLRADVIDARGH